MVVNTTCITTTNAPLTGYLNAQSNNNNLINLNNSGNYNSSSNNNGNINVASNLNKYANFQHLNFGGSNFKQPTTTANSTPTLPSPEGKSIQELKRSMRLDFSSPDNLKKSLSTPEILSVLHFASPDLEKLITQHVTTLAASGATNTPTPTQFFYPKNVTAEQEQYARGFVDALNQLHSLRGSYFPLPSNLLSPGFVTSTIQQQDNAKDENSVLSNRTRETIKTTVSSMEQFLRSLTGTGVWTPTVPYLPSTAATTIGQLAAAVTNSSVVAAGFPATSSLLLPSSTTANVNPTVTVGGAQVTTQVPSTLAMEQLETFSANVRSIQTGVILPTNVQRNVSKRDDLLNGVQVHVINQHNETRQLTDNENNLQKIVQLPNAANAKHLVSDPPFEYKINMLPSSSNANLNQSKRVKLENEAEIDRQHPRIAIIRGSPSPYLPAVGENLTLTTSNTPPSSSVSVIAVEQQQPHPVHHAPSAAHFVTLSTSATAVNSSKGLLTKNNVAYGTASGSGRKRPFSPLDRMKQEKPVVATDLGRRIAAASVASSSNVLLKRHDQNQTDSAVTSGREDNSDEDDQDYFDDRASGTTASGSPCSTPSFRPPPGCDPIDPIVQEKLKLERKRARNRLAASKCRKRKLEIIDALSKHVREITEKNELLRSALDVLRSDVIDLKRAVENHRKSGCKV